MQSRRPDETESGQCLSLLRRGGQQEQHPSYGSPHARVYAPCLAANDSHTGQERRTRPEPFGVPDTLIRSSTVAGRKGSGLFYAWSDSAGGGYCYVSETWPAEDAKARFSELLKTSLAKGPQIVTKRGVEVAVLAPIDAWRRLEQRARPDLKQLLLSPDARADTLTPPRPRHRGRCQ